jgi:phosphomevalonate kinase
MDRLLSAPGKLFVSGEYAVLWGGVARVLAVGPRTAAMVRRRSDRQVELHLEQGRLTGRATPLGVNWSEAVPTEFHFVARTVDLALRAIAREVPGFAIAFAPSPQWQGRKLGLGSSARACVLAAEAVRWATDASFDALKLALMAHAEAQKGKGSGGDVAACFVGGLARYQRFETAQVIEAAQKGALPSALRQAPPVEVSRLTAPTFPLVYAFSGESASTTSLVRQIEASWTPAQRAAFVETSDALGDTLEQALVKGDFSGVAASCEALQALLFSLGPTRAASLERIVAIASAQGCAGKQSGAGGGDGCLLVAPDHAHAENLLEALRGRGFYALLVQAEPGLQGETRPDPTLSSWLAPS